jgi:hypothetical protein
VQSASNLLIKAGISKSKTKKHNDVNNKAFRRSEGSTR